ncbi:MAG: hypothetical protein KGI04_03410 [Candidatus Micrarchaeota archaeon]|nr:hypothetical protein [Candidatus Micrarchaeota archaeon]
MNKEIYIWVAVILAIVSVALYFRYFYQPAVSIALGLSPSSQPALYPYQKAAFEINVFNNGSSAISNMSLGVVINGNLSTLYKVTLPAGKQTSIAFNYSPTAAGSYNISVVADPGRLYNIADRSHSSAGASIAVLAAENATPSALLPKDNISSFRQATVTNGAYLLGTYLYDQFNISTFTLTGNGQVNAFLKPILNLTADYIRNISVAEADYLGNGSVYSVWIKGYISPSIFAAATTGSALSTVNVSTNDGTATFIKMLNDTTFCGWYSDGWIKILAENGTAPCYSIINQSVNAGAVNEGGLGSRFSSNLTADNATLLANYSTTGASGDSLAKLFIVSNSSFVYDTVSNVSSGWNTTCFGIISAANNTSFCSSYVFPKSGSIGAISLVKTTAYKGAYNLTAFALINTSSVLSRVGTLTGMLSRLNVSGPSLTFTSGIVNSCAFNASVGCSGLVYNNGTVSFTLKNNAGDGIHLNSVSCYTQASVFSTPLNYTLRAGNESDVSTPCYSFTTKLGGGISLDLHLNLLLNYTISNSTQLLNGTAFVPFG